MARIEVRQSFMDGVTASGEELINNFNQVAKQLNVPLSDDNQKQLLSTLRNVDTVSARVTAVANALEPTVKTLPALVSDTGVVLKRADTLLANVNQRVEAFERAARSTEQLGTSGVALSEAMMNESLPRLNVLLEDVQRSSRNLERLLYDINEQPHSFVFGRNPLPPGPGEPGFGERR
jgi:phospholipid/cholesterol/gamma-HCH transport system substrate-binding protein